MKTPDAFLRSMRLECCGHMSRFRDPVMRNQRRGGLSDFFEAENLLMAGKAEESIGEIPMSRKVNKVFYPDFKLEYEDDYLFCPKCAKKHAKECRDFEAYAAMPVVNFPRMGVCGYTGGTIDTERDGNV
jgi:hypothetical protein